MSGGRGFQIERGGTSSGGAPTTADYLVGTADPTLSAEIVVGTTPGGELGGTWASPTVDAVHSGSAHHAQAHAINGADHTGTLDDAQIPAGVTRDSEINAIDFLVGTATAFLSGEIVVGTSPGGELGGTWASPTVDATHSGSAHHTRLHSTTDTLDHSFPGGTTTFLRADGTFAAPTAAAADPVYSPGSFTVVTETARVQPTHLKLTTTQRATIEGTGRLVMPT